MADRVPQSTALRIALKAYLATDHVSLASGKTIPVVISKNGAAFGNPSAGATNATEIANGWYFVDLSATDTGTLGPIIIRGTEGTIDPVEVVLHSVNPNHGGYVGIPNAAAEAAGGLYTRGTGAGQINQDANGRIDTRTAAMLADVVTAAAIATDAIGSAEFSQAAADKVWATTSRTLTAFGFSVTVGTNSDKTGYSLSAGGIQAIWDALTSALTTAGSIGKRIVDFLTGDAFVRLGAPAGASVSADIAAVKAETATIQAKTTNLPPVPASQPAVETAITASTTAIIAAIPTSTANADALLKRDMSVVTGEAARSPLNALRAIRNKTDQVTTPGSVLVMKEDDTTVAWSAVLTTNPAAEPIVVVDPA